MSLKSAVLLQVVIPQERAESFMNIFANIKLLTQTVTLHFEEERLFMQTMDNAHVSVLECVLHKSWFAAYHLQKPTTLSFDVVLFSKILSTRDRFLQQSIQMCVDTSSEDVLTISFNTDALEKSVLINKQFEMPLIEIDGDILQIPEVDYSVEMALKSSDFTELIQQLRIFGDTLDMGCSETEITMNSVSYDKGKMKSRFDIDKLTAYSIVEGETVKTSFSLRYLNDICAFHKLSPIVELYISPEMPLRITYYLNGTVGGGGGGTTEMERESAYMRFYLAPKITDGDEEGEE
jgi:proliferating cell nuclear antigen PCNA